VDVDEKDSTLRICLTPKVWENLVLPATFSMNVEEDVCMRIRLNGGEKMDSRRFAIQFVI